MEGGRLPSKVNVASFECGRSEVLAVGELRNRVTMVESGSGKLRVAELVGDAKALHADVANAGALEERVGAMGRILRIGKAKGFGEIFGPSGLTGSKGSGGCVTWIRAAGRFRGRVHIYARSCIDARLRL